MFLKIGRKLTKVLTAIICGGGKVGSIFFLPVHILLTFSSKDAWILTCVWLEVCPLFSKRKRRPSCRRTREQLGCPPWTLPKPLLKASLQVTCSCAQRRGRLIPPAQVSPVQAGRQLGSCNQHVRKCAHSDISSRWRKEARKRSLSDPNPQSRAISGPEATWAWAAVGCLPVCLPDQGAVLWA